MPPSIDSFILALKKKEDLWNQQTQFEIKYSRYECHDVLKSQYSGGDLLVDWDTVKKGTKWAVNSTLLGLDEKNLPKSKSSNFAYPEIHYFLLKDGQYCEYQETNETCIVDYAKEVISNFFNELVYFDFQGINLCQRIADSHNVDYDSLLTRDRFLQAKNFFPETFEKSRHQLQVSDSKEEINGYFCWKIEKPGSEIVWIDAENLSIIRKRTSSFGKDLPRQFDVYFEDYREVAPDLWLPYSINVDFYAHFEVEPKSVWGKVAKRQKYRVRSIDFENVPDSLVDVTPAIGTLVSDAVRLQTYRISDPNADPFAGPIAEGLKVNQHVKYRAIGIMIGSIMIFIAVWLLLRRTEGK
jgi:hypothetical protein